MNLGLNTANKYVDAAWDVTEKNKGIKKGAYSASVKDVNKDLKKQKLADLAGVNILGLLESLGSAAAADGIESKARNSLAEDGYSGADTRRLAKEVRSLESKGENSKDAKKAVVNKEKAIKTWENNGYSRKDAEKMYAVSGQDFDTMQVAHNEEKRKQEEDAARLANAGQSVTPEAVKGEQGEVRNGQKDDGNSDQPYRKPEYHRNEKGELVSDSGIGRNHVAAIGWPADLENYMGTNVVDEGNQTQKKVEGATEHTVKAGDSWWKIASENNMTVEQLKEHNGVTTDVIRAGQKIKIPSSETGNSESNDAVFGYRFGNGSVSNNGIKMLTNLEGKKVVNGSHMPYDDKTGEIITDWNEWEKKKTGGKATIGYGVVIDEKGFTIKYKNGIAEKDAKDLIKDKVQDAQKLVNLELKKNALQVSQSQYDALVISAYNHQVGTQKIIQTLATETNPIKREQVWQTHYNTQDGNYSEGLNNRKYSEYQLYTSGSYYRYEKKNNAWTYKPI